MWSQQAESSPGPFSGRPQAGRDRRKRHFLNFSMTTAGCGFDYKNPSWLFFRESSMTLLIQTKWELAA